jgi:hypothetical protein
MAQKIEREQRKVAIIDPGFRIEGKIHMLPRMRLSEFVNTSRQFIPITEAEVFSSDGSKKLYTSEFMEINRDSIITMIPLEPNPDTT